MEPICMIIYFKKKIWFKCCIYEDCLCGLSGKLDEVVNKHRDGIDDILWDGASACAYKIKSLHVNSFGEDIQACNVSDEKIQRLNTIRLKLDGYVLSALTASLIYSKIYRKKFTEKCSLYVEDRLKQSHVKSPLCVIVNLIPAKRELLDYRWNDRMITLATEKRELENAMYWLSTLGGAFSALGDEFQHCAVMAGRISVGQLWLALRLGDALTVARCKLFLALSLMQQGRLRAARQLVLLQYVVAKSVKEVDPRLSRMCQGVWAKLRYAYQQRHNRRKSKSRQA
ncbi:uncharacterized protein LOC126284401 [Schistocerca gregaria]|uniref:uncharacterized protein LOC126284401 n=1 Tax=Schistocerca gregaria TaxID=7010 RepID=UPI00211F093D|nr:uncharacterized protein LOC126284401 [Schistocerca gregaria]